MLRISADTLPPLPDAATSPVSGLGISIDTLGGRAASDTRAWVVDLSRVKTSSEALDETVEYGSRDSMWFDVARKQVHLYGNAFVKYATINLKAGYILMDYNLNTVTAEGLADSSGRVAGLPQFQDGEQKFSAKKLRYNFKTKKGIIYEAYTQQEDLYVLGTKAKFLGAQNPPDDTTRSAARSTIYNQDALLTTCNHPEPHFGIRTKKLKVIPDKLVVTGFSNLEIGGVPTPLILPFGFYPVTKHKKSGVILPNDFDFSDRWGLGLRNIGYYIPIHRGMDLTLRGDLYFQGTHSLGANLKYLKKYKHNGNLDLIYNNRISEDKRAKRVSEKSFRVAWSHSQDNKAHPTRNFGGSVNIQTNRDQSRNLNDFRSVYQNTLSSNLTYRQSFPGKPFQLTASMSHSQNTTSRQMTINLPNVNFTMQQIYPFKRKKLVGTERWYERISLNYTSQLQNTLLTTDTTLFSRATLESARMGIQHRANSTLPLKIFKYITLSPSVNYEENWYPYVIEHELLHRIHLKYRVDTVQGVPVSRIDTALSRWGVDTIKRNWGFYAFRNWNVALSANTALFNTRQFKNGWLRGIRHTFKPTVSIGFGPDFTKSRYNYFRPYYTSLLPQLADTLTYNIFEQGIFGRPSNFSQQLTLSYGFTNLLEIKHYSKRDSAVVKKRIFDNLAFNGAYIINPQGDSLHWTTVSTGGVFRLLKGVTQINWLASFDPYLLDKKGQRINRFVFREKGRLVRLDRFGMSINSALPLSKLRDWGNSRQNTDGSNLPVNTNQPPPPRSVVHDDLLAWFENFRFDHTIAFEYRPIVKSNRSAFVVARHSIGIYGSLPLNSKWAFNIGNISYDFISKALAFPDIGISRDLHCWTMSFSWQPTRGTYQFFINVKPGSLDFLKLPYRKNNEDGRFAF